MTSYQNVDRTRVCVPLGGAGDYNMKVCFKGESLPYLTKIYRIV